MQRKKSTRDDEDGSSQEVSTRADAEPGYNQGRYGPFKYRSGTSTADGGCT